MTEQEFNFYAENGAHAAETIEFLQDVMTRIDAEHPGIVGRCTQAQRESDEVAHG